MTGSWGGSFTSCPHAPDLVLAEQTEADVAAVQAVAKEWIAAVNAGDVARLVAEYTDDAIRMRPGALL